MTLIQNRDTYVSCDDDGDENIAVNIDNKEKEMKKQHGNDSR